MNIFSLIEKQYLQILSVATKPAYKLPWIYKRETKSGLTLNSVQMIKTI